MKRKNGKQEQNGRCRGSFPEAWTAVYLCLLMTVFLLCFGAGGYTNLAEVKFRVFLWLTGGYLVVLAIGLCEMLLMRHLELPGVRALLRATSWTQRFAACYLAFTLLSWLCSPWRAESFLGMTRCEGLLTIVLYGLTFLAVSIFGRPKKWMLAVFGVSMTLYCLISFLQLAGWNPLGLYPDGITYYDSGKAYSGAYLGTVGNTDLVAALLCVAVPMFLFGLIRQRGKLRLLLLIPLAACVVLASMMQVSAAVVGLAVGLLISVPFAVSRERRKRAALAVAAVALAGFAAVLLLPDLPGMLGEAHSLLHGDADDTFGSGRIYIWRNVLTAIRERPLLGGGPDTLAARMTAGFERFDAATNTVYQASIDVAHNEYLNVFANQGLFALLAFLAMLGSALAAWIKKPDSGAALLAGSAVACYCVQALFGISMCMTAPFFWIALAFLDASTMLLI